MVIHTRFGKVFVDTSKEMGGYKNGDRIVYIPLNQHGKVLGVGRGKQKDQKEVLWFQLDSKDYPTYMYPFEAETIQRV